MGEVDKKQLEELLRKEITKLFEVVLDYTSIAVPDNQTFKNLRGKIMNSSSKTFYTVISELQSYEVTNLDIHEDFIEIKK